MDKLVNILIPMGVLGALGFIFAVVLSIASDVFKVEVDERFEAVRGALPGVNCGACGYPGCDGLAMAITEGKAPLNACPIGGKPTADKLKEIME